MVALKKTHPLVFKLMIVGAALISGFALLLPVMESIIGSFKAFLIFLGLVEGAENATTIATIRKTIATKASAVASKAAAVANGVLTAANTAYTFATNGSVGATVASTASRIAHGTGDTQISNVNNIYVIAATLTETYTITVPFSQDILSELENGREYVVAFYAKIVDAQNHPLFNGPLNNRFSIIKDTEEIFSNQISAIGETQLLTASFIYDSESTYNFKFYAGYVGYYENDISVEFSQEPTIVPIEYFEGFEDPMELFNDKNLLIINGDFAELNLEALQKSGSYVFEDINTAGLETDETILVTGFKITGDCILSGDTIITAGIYSLKDELLHGICAGWKYYTQYKGGHYVFPISISLTKKTITIADPTKGVITYTLNEFKKGLDLLSQPSLIVIRR